MTIKINFRETVAKTFGLKERDVELIYDVFIDVLLQEFASNEKLTIDKIGCFRIKRLGKQVNVSFTQSPLLSAYLRENDWKTIRKLKYPELYGDDE